MNSTARQVKFLVAMLEGMLPKDVRGQVGRGAPPEPENNSDFFDGLGNIPEAPKYLRIKGKVRRATALLMLAMMLCYAGPQPQYLKA
jgi:hypothetical protein